MNNSHPIDNLAPGVLQTILEEVYRRAMRGDLEGDMNDAFLELSDSGTVYTDDGVVIHEDLEQCDEAWSQAVAQRESEALAAQRSKDLSEAKRIEMQNAGFLAAQLVEKRQALKLLDEIAMDPNAWVNKLHVEAEEELCALEDRTGLHSVHVQYLFEE